MNTAPFPMKRGDTGPNLTIKVTLAGLSLTGAMAYFLMRKANRLFVPTTDATVVSDNTHVTIDDVNNTLTYAWQAGDTDQEPGDYCGEFEVTLNGGQVITWPNDGYIPIPILQDLGGAAP